MLKIANLDLSQNFINTALTMNLIGLSIQINNTVVFSKHISNKNYVNSKPKVHQDFGAIPCFVSQGCGLWTFIHRTEQLDL